MTEYTMPRSVLRHRPIYNHPQVDRVTGRARRPSPTPKGEQTTEPAHMQWSWPFFTGMFLTFAILLVGQIHF